MTTEIHHKGATYRIDNLTAFQQLHVSRRISPLIAPLLPIVQDWESESVSLEDAAAHLGPITDLLASLGDETVEYIVNTTLSVVKREQGNYYYPIWANGQLMYDDLTMADGMQLAYQVIVDQLGGFIDGFLQSAGQESVSAKTPASTAN